MNRRDFLRFGSASALLALFGTELSATGNKKVFFGQTGLVFDPLYYEHWLSPGHPESPARLKAIIDKLEHATFMSDLFQIKIRHDVLPYLIQIHTNQHIASIKANYGHSHDVAFAVVEGVLAATAAVCSGNIKNAFCATRPPGHHATNTGQVEGFCFYNSIAVAARYAQATYNINKVLIIDWDYHHGNGTEAAFYDDPTVMFFSTHDLYAYPGTGDPEKKGDGDGEGFNINVHLDCGATDDDIIEAFNKFLIPRAEKFRPELILISAGFDSRKDDLLGCYNITDNGFIKLTDIVMELADKYCNGKIISVLEGGYNVQGTASAVKHHVKRLMTT